MNFQLVDFTFHPWRLVYYQNGSLTRAVSVAKSSTTSGAPPRYPLAPFSRTLNMLPFVWDHSCVQAPVIRCHVVVEVRTREFLILLLPR